jgi:hypothetical protein
MNRKKVCDIFKKDQNRLKFTDIVDKIIALNELLKKKN